MAIAGSSMAVMGLIVAGTAESAGPAAAPALRGPPPPPTCAPPANFTPLAQCLDASRKATVGTAACPNAVLSGTQLTGANALDTVTIQSGAQLVISDGNTALDTAGIDVFGTLQIGTASCPIQGSNNVTIKFLGAKPPNCAHNAAPHDKSCHTKGIYVNSGGTLMMYGKKGAGPGGVSWTRLSQPAGPVATYGAGKGVIKASTSATQILVADDVSNDWRANDWIVVGTTDFASYNSEFVKIGTETRTMGTQITLSSSPLVNYHFGGPAPGAGAASFTDGADKNYGIDERAEVGLISRNIKLTAAIPTPDPTGASLHWGGEIHVMNGFNRVEIQGVELEKFGKDQLGSYPIHFHMVGTPTNPPLVDGNSIHHSYNKCIVLHASSGITISNNVCARIVGHIFALEDGTEANNTFRNNLGLGAMQYYFPQYLNSTYVAQTNACTPNANQAPPATAALDPYFWNGDYLANPTLYPAGSPPIAYDGYNIPDYTMQTNLVHGQCYDRNGGGVGPTCNPETAIYFEPASGFWLTNPTTVLTGNSIGGCQGVGRGIWYLPNNNNLNQPLGTFRNNSVHACYNGLDTAADNGLISQNLAPQNASKQDLIAVFEAATASRNRFKGIWVRPNWNHVVGARLATNYEGVSLVSSGGTEGSAPGVWSMLSHSVLAGMSSNNPERFGPCPSDNGHGCLCETPGTFSGQGYPTPKNNFQGYMFYDGPARIVSDRFVNFNKDVTPVLYDRDKAYLADYSNRNQLPFDNTRNFVYEGDAAFGWIQTNLQSVPPTQYTEDLTFENTDLRHQVYTREVNLGDFQDGDKNTVILDKDGTLTGYQVVAADTRKRTHKFPVSLNNLAFLGSADLASTRYPNNPSTVDECLATGGQDPFAENRATSLISPFDYATLEASVLTCEDFPNLSGLAPDNPRCKNRDTITFVKDFIDYGVHQSMTLSGRNGNGVYEPKVVDGWGYTLHKAPNGFPKFFSLGLTDANNEDLAKGLTTNPFNIRVGVCLRTQSGTIPPADTCASNPASCTPNFTVQRGYKSYGGPNNNAPTLTQFWNDLPQCHNLDNQTFTDKGGGNLFKTNIPNPAQAIAGCPSPGKDTSGRGPVDIPIVQLSQVATIAEVDALHYYYDAARGMLFLQVNQDRPNALGPSPLGSCGINSPEPCPQAADPVRETFYSCPAEGCILYTVTVNSAAYQPIGPTDCRPYDGTGKDDGTAGYTQVYPQGTDRLAYVVPTGTNPPGISQGQVATNLAVASNLLRGVNYPHNVAAANAAPYCPNPVK
jgi:parallel beta-helix repeat protein